MKKLFYYVAGYAYARLLRVLLRHAEPIGSALLRRQVRIHWETWTELAAGVYGLERSDAERWAAHQMRTRLSDCGPVVRRLADELTAPWFDDATVA